MSQVWDRNSVLMSSWVWKKKRSQLSDRGLGKYRYDFKVYN